MTFSIYKVAKITRAKKSEIISFLLCCFSNEPNYKSIVYSNIDLEFCILQTNDKLEIIGHSSIISRRIEIDNTSLLIGGIGNVAIQKEYQGKGHGRELVSKTNSHLISNGYQIGMLFCSPELVKFYKSCGWMEKSSGKVYYKSNGKKQKISEVTLLLPIEISQIVLDKLLFKKIDISGDRW